MVYIVRLLVEVLLDAVNAIVSQLQLTIDSYAVVFAVLTVADRFAKRFD